MSLQILFDSRNDYSQDMISHDNRSTNRRRPAVIGVACILVIAVLALVHRTPRSPNWTLVAGRIQDTRIVADRGLETKAGGQLTWRAEYKVGYTVAGREYSVWTDSGVRGDSEPDVRLALPQFSPSCQVTYNPGNPEKSFADCRSKPGRMS